MAFKKRNRSIWKYPLQGGLPVQDVGMPKYAEILSVGKDPSGQICLWAEVDPEAEREIRMIGMRGTGNAFNSESKWAFIGTINDGPYMWHVYDAGIKK